LKYYKLAVFILNLLGHFCLYQVKPQAKRNHAMFPAFNLMLNHFSYGLLFLINTLPVLFSTPLNEPGAQKESKITCRSGYRIKVIAFVLKRI
jgi:hypothetical protein